ncbi:MAG TPA: signal recognition particle protein [Acidimicrobiia bacterium]|nr:signal recognition particle protein [Acidimicrobiia bacterium]
MFDSLSSRFEGIFDKLKSSARITDSEIEEVSGDIRRALIDADVNIIVINEFVDHIASACKGITPSPALTSSQQIIKIVNDELTRLLGSEAVKLNVSSKPPTVILLAGLQGSGKTTHAGKLAKHLTSQGKNVLLVGADLARPAAVEQLRVLGAQIDVPVYSEGSNPVKVVKKAFDEAARLNRDTMIVDTAGRLQIDSDLMNELEKIAKVAQPDNTLLVVDAMTGQEAVNVAQTFNERIPLTGVILTKIDGDARGGAALSVRSVTGAPIMFVGTGERLEDFEDFYPDRMASRILGMGDVLTLIEKAETAFTEEQAMDAGRKLASGDFGLQDFLDQLKMVQNMGPLGGLMKMMPGMPKEMKDVDIDDGQIAQVEAIILSMTRQERDDPSLVSGSRRARIASGSGTTTTQVNQLLKQFSQMRSMMKGMMGDAMGMPGSGKKGKGKKGKKKPSKTGMMRNAMAMQKEMKKNPGAFEGLMGDNDMSSFLPPPPQFPKK